MLDPHAAVSGVAIVTGHLGSAVGTSALVAEWSTAVVLRVALDAKGAATGDPTPFLTGLEHPVALTLAADGALLVGDWGTGRVYRIEGSS